MTRYRRGTAALRRLLSGWNPSPRRLRVEETLVTLTNPSWRVPVVARRHTSDLAAFRAVSDGAHHVELHEPPELLVDLGANVGYMSVDFASRYPDARVLAVEPHPENVAVLRRNVRSLPEVEVIEAAVWPRAGTLVLEDPGKGFWGYRVREHDGGRGTVRAVTIPELLKHAGAEKIDLLKIDIEGSELELFSGDVEWLERVRVLEIELHDHFRPGCREALEEALGATRATFEDESRGDLTVLRRSGQLA